MSTSKRFDRIINRITDEMLASNFAEELNHKLLEQADLYRAGIIRGLTNVDLEYSISMALKNAMNMIRLAANLENNKMPMPSSDSIGLEIKSGKVMLDTTNDKLFLHDKDGLVQAVFDPEDLADIADAAKLLKDMKNGKIKPELTEESEN
jgi:hypothetical protein